MTDIEVTNTYIYYMMGKLPEEQGPCETHVMSKGESLWSIAKKAVSVNGKATNAQISEYMLRIAKLNGLDTSEKMNKINVNTKIIVPSVEKAKAAQKTSEQTSVKPRSYAEQSLLDVLKILEEDKTIFVEKPRLGTSTSLYHVYNRYEKDGYMSYKHPVISFEMDEKGKLIRASFEDSRQHIRDIGYDYNINNDGKIYENNFNFDGKKTGALTGDEMNMLKQKLKELSTKANLVI